MHTMTQNGGYQGPILKKSHVKRLNTSGGRGVWRILTCLIMLCLIAGTGQASSDNATAPHHRDRSDRTLYPEAGNSVCGDSGEAAASPPSCSGPTPPGRSNCDQHADRRVGSCYGTAEDRPPEQQRKYSDLSIRRSNHGLGITTGECHRGEDRERIMMQCRRPGPGRWTQASAWVGSPEGKYCAAGTAAWDILLTHSRGGLLWKTQPGSAVTAVAVGPDGAFVAAGTEDGSIYLLNSRGDVRWTHDAGSAVQRVSIAPRGTSFAAGTAGSTVLLLTTRRGGTVWRGDDPISGPLDPRGSRVGAGTDRVCAPAERCLVGSGVRQGLEPEGENSAVTAVTFSSPADYLAIGSDNHNVYYFTFASRTPPTVILEQGTVTPETTTPATLRGDMQAAPEIDSTPGDTADPAPQEAPGYSLAVALGAIAVTAVYRRTGR